MSALRGKQAHYNQAVQTWYFKSTLNGFGVDNQNKSIIPPFLIDNTSSKTEASIYSALDFENYFVFVLLIPLVSKSIKKIKMLK